MPYRSIAQLGEHLPYKQGVVGSSPTGATTVVLWEVYLLVVIKSPYATVNGSNSAGKRTIEIPQDESDSIGCSAYLSLLLAQSGLEHQSTKLGVTGSNPVEETWAIAL